MHQCTCHGRSCRQPRSQISSWCTYQRPRHACSSPWIFVPLATSRPIWRGNTRKFHAEYGLVDPIAWVWQLMIKSLLSSLVHVCSKIMFFLLLLYIYDIPGSSIEIWADMLHIWKIQVYHMYIFTYIYIYRVKLPTLPETTFRTPSILPATSLAETSPWAWHVARTLAAPVVDQRIRGASHRARYEGKFRSS